MDARPDPTSTLCVREREGRREREGERGGRRKNELWVESNTLPLSLSLSLSVSLILNPSLSLSLSLLRSLTIVCLSACDAVVQVACVPVLNCPIVEPCSEHIRIVRTPAHVTHTLAVGFDHSGTAWIAYVRHHDGRVLNVRGRKREGGESA